MPTRMSWRPGREGATLYVYPETSRADPGEREPGEHRPAGQDADAAQAGDPPPQAVLKAS